MTKETKTILLELLAAVKRHRTDHEGISKDECLSNLEYKIQGLVSKK